MIRKYKVYYKLQYGTLVKDRCYEILHKKEFLIQKSIVSHYTNEKTYVHKSRLKLWSKENKI